MFWSTVHHFVALLPSCFAHLKKWVANKKHKYIQQWLVSKLPFDFQKYTVLAGANHRTLQRQLETQKEQTREIAVKPKVPSLAWVCWWDGEEQLPLIPQICLSSLKKNAGFEKIILVTKHNYDEHVDIPEYLVDKFESKLISIQTFTDILRAFILYQQGGLWLDATILATGKFEYQNEQALISIRHAKPTNFVSNGRWTAYALGGSKHHPLFGFLADAFSLYYEKYDVLVDYFLIDYLISIAHHHIPCVATDIDQLPINNAEVIFLQRHLANPYSKDEFTKLLSTTQLHKLKWKIDAPSNDSQYYSYLEHIIGMFLNSDASLNNKDK